MSRSDPVSSHVKDGIILVYDGGCPVCSFTAKAARLKKTAGNLTLVNARIDQSHSIFEEIHHKALNLNEGMVLKVSNRLYHGADALHMMALFSGRSDMFNNMIFGLFKYKLSAQICYPLLRIGRNFILCIKGIPPITRK